MKRPCFFFYIRVSSLSSEVLAPGRMSFLLEVTGSLLVGLSVFLISFISLPCVLKRFIIKTETTMYKRQHPARSPAMRPR